MFEFFLKISHSPRVTHLHRSPGWVTMLFHYNDCFFSNKCYKLFYKGSYFLLDAEYNFENMPARDSFSLQPISHLGFSVHEFCVLSNVSTSSMDCVNHFTPLRADPAQLFNYLCLWIYGWRGFFCIRYNNTPESSSNQQQRCPDSTAALLPAVLSGL